MIEALTTRLAGQVPDLANRVFGAADYSKVRGSGHPPGSGPAAFLLPLALRGDPPELAAGAYEQAFAEAISVVIVATAVDDRSGERALMRLRPLLFEIIAAFAGWTPGDQTGVFSFTAGQLVGADKGLITYELNFSITDQLRITS